MSANLMDILLLELFRDGHRYAGGLEQRQATLPRDSGPTWRRLIAGARDRSRDLVERGAAQMGFVHRHFDPRVAAARFGQILAISDELQVTYARLADEHSRRAMIDLLKLQVLGPYHAPLPLTPELFRQHQAYVEREMQVEPATFEVSDPWFSPLSLYSVPIENGESIVLHDHSVDIVSVFLLGQYSYARGPARVQVEPGDTVLDLGGCWGDTALYFASLVGPNGKVYTFEFDPENVKILRANLALNPKLADRIELVERAVWHRSGESLQFSPAGRCTFVGGEEPAPAELQVSTITVDDFVQEASIEQLGLVKMDVEGAEMNVLRGAHQSLSRLTPKLAIAAYHRSDDLVQIPEQLSAIDVGYSLYLDTFSPVEEETVLFAKPRITAAD